LSHEGNIIKHRLNKEVTLLSKNFCEKYEGYDGDETLCQIRNQLQELTKSVENVQSEVLEKFSYTF